MKYASALTLVLAFAAPAAADIAPTPPEQLECPRGAVGAIDETARTSWCAPSTCESDADCDGGRTCSAEPIGLCVEDYPIPTVRVTPGTDPSTVETRTMRRVRERACEPDGTCLSLRATCEQARRCVAADPSEGARAEEADEADRGGGSEGAADEGSAPTPAAATAASGCGCRVTRGDASAGLGALALLGFAALARRRRR